MYESPQDFFNGLTHKRLQATLENDRKLFREQLTTGAPDVSHVGTNLMFEYPEVTAFVRQMVAEQGQGHSWSEDEMKNILTIAVMAIGTIARVAEEDSLPSLE